MLVVFGGLPGVGKTTLARAIANHLAAAYVRVDAIEAALWRAGVGRDQPTGLAAYVAAHAVADGSLSTGADVVVDAVNPVREAREGWLALAASLSAPIRLIEVVCSDPDEHRRRVESRDSDLEGHAAPTWSEVRDRLYERWDEDRCVVDTASEPTAASVCRILAYVAA